jgi:hypothetical protein
VRLLVGIAKSGRRGRRNILLAQDPHSSDFVPIDCCKAQGFGRGDCIADVAKSIMLAISPGDMSAMNCHNGFLARRAAISGGIDDRPDGHV